jgi:hypothetical protein
MDWRQGCHKVCIKCDEGYHLNDDNECVPCPEDGPVSKNPYCSQFEDDGTCCLCSYRSVFN